MRLTQFINEDKATTMQESAHAVAFGVAQITGKILNDTIWPEEALFRESFANHTTMKGVGVDELWKWVLKNTEWTKIIKDNINALRRHKTVRTGNRYTVYRGEGIMNQVYDEAKKLLKSLKLGKMGMDKWNPGDIWLAVGDVNVPTTLDSIGRFNEWIAKELKSGNLISISLKKASGRSKVSYIDQQTKKDRYAEFWRIQKPAAPLNTGMTIQTYNRKLTFNVRSFFTRERAPITSEIVYADGSARHGKATIQKIIKVYGIPKTTLSQIRKFQDDLPYVFGLISGLWKDNGWNFSAADVKKDWYKRKVNDKIDGTTEVIDGRGKATPKDGFLLSLINSLEFGAFLMKNKGHADVITNGLFMYGSSMSDWSSDFLKVA